MRTKTTFQILQHYAVYNFTSKRIGWKRSSSIWPLGTNPDFEAMWIWRVWLTFTATRGSNGHKSVLKRLSLFYYRHLNKTSLYSSKKTIFLSLHMVLTHEISILYSSWFLFHNPIFLLAKSCPVSNGSVYIQIRARHLCMLSGPKSSACGGQWGK